MKMNSKKAQTSGDIEEFKPDRIEVWSGIPKEEVAEVWFVSLWEGEGEWVVFDGPSESDALEAAEDCADDWDIPIIIQRPPTLN
jgi:hypothetical protein